MDQIDRRINLKRKIHQKNQQRKLGVSNEDVEEVFNKKFHYEKQKESVWQLPPSNECFQSHYQLQILQTLKTELNSVKSQLNDYVIEVWSPHTRKQDPAGEVPYRLKHDTEAEFVTVAWCKFYECLKQYPLVTGPKLNSLHLCEAPGAFVAALNHYLYSVYDPAEVQWNWLATTLNPYYEGNSLNKMIVDDRFMLGTMDHWLFHKDFSGNIINNSNIDHMREQCKILLKGEVELITADGSINCIEAPDEQEDLVAQLHFAEILAALTILAEGGSFIIKMFTLFEASSVSKMFLLNCLFKEVHCFKPATSKRGNSELYVICLGFKKEQQSNSLQHYLDLLRLKLLDSSTSVIPMFDKNHLPVDFLEQHEKCVRLFMFYQMTAIESNIFTYKCNNMKSIRNNMRTEVCLEYYRRYQIKKIDEKHRILSAEQQSCLERPYNYFFYKGSHTEREILKATSPENVIALLNFALYELQAATSDSIDVTLKDEHISSENIRFVEKIYKGAPSDNLHSSLFAGAEVMNLYLKLRDAYSFLQKKEPMWQTKPKFTLGYKNNNSFHKVICANIESNHLTKIQQTFFVNILEGIIAHKPTIINFSAFPFLTHYSVSLLRYLNIHFFPKITLQASETVFEITLETSDNGTCIYDNPETINSLSSFRDKLIDGNETVLCVLRIEKLHRNAFSDNLILYNNQLLLHNFKILSTQH